MHLSDVVQHSLERRGWASCNGLLLKANPFRVSGEPKDVLYPQGKPVFPMWELAVVRVPADVRHLPKRVRTLVSRVRVKYEKVSPLASNPAVRRENHCLVLYRG